jgi:hypothetical protein
LRPGHEWSRDDIPANATRAVKDYLASLDGAAFGAASEVRPKFVSPSDPAAQWTGALRGPAFFAYANNYLIDTDHAIIVDVEATRAIRQAEVGAARNTAKNEGRATCQGPARIRALHLLLGRRLRLNPCARSYKRSRPSSGLRPGFS